MAAEAHINTRSRNGSRRTSTSGTAATEQAEQERQQQTGNVAAVATAQQ